MESWGVIIKTITKHVDLRTPYLQSCSPTFPLFLICECTRSSSRSYDPPQQLPFNILNESCHGASASLEPPFTIERIQYYGRRCFATQAIIDQHTTKADPAKWKYRLTPTLICTDISVYERCAEWASKSRIVLPREPEWKLRIRSGSQEWRGDETNQKD